MHMVKRTGAGQRGDRLSRLAAALDLLNERIRIESQDRDVALALRARFAPSLPDIRHTQQVLAAHLGRSIHPPAALNRLNASLDALAAALTFPLPAVVETAPSRPALRRAQFRAGRLDASAREMLGAIAKAMAVGAAGVALYTGPTVAAAGTCSAGPS